MKFLRTWTNNLSKLFDDIRHDLMVSKLQSIGVSNAACNLFGSYLSQPNHVTLGVPQGSVLGPGLFTLYVNDLLSVPTYCHAMGYVDDTKIFLGLPSKTQLSHNNYLSAIGEWCCTNSLAVKPDKTKLLVIGAPQITRSLASFATVKLLGKEIKPAILAVRCPRNRIVCKHFEVGVSVLLGNERNR